MPRSLDLSFAEWESFHDLTTGNFVIVGRVGNRIRWCAITPVAIELSLHDLNSLARKCMTAVAMMLLTEEDEPDAR